MFEAWEDLPLSESGIKHFHRELLKYVAKDELHRGEYKKKENQVRLVDTRRHDKGVLFDTTPAYLTSKEMTELVEWTRAALANKSYHPLYCMEISWWSSSTFTPLKMAMAASRAY